MASSLFRSIASNWFGQGAAIIIGLCIAPYVVRTLGAEQYGVWSLIVSITTQLIILDFGIRHSLVKYISHYRALNDTTRINESVSSALALLMLLGLLGLVVIISLVEPFSAWFHIPATLVHAAKIALIVAAIDGALELVCGLFNGILAGSERYDIMNGVNVMRLALNASLTILLLESGYGLAGVATAAFAARVAQKLTLGIYIFSRKVKPSIAPRYITRARTAEIVSYGFWVCLITLASRVIYQTDSIVIGAVLTPSRVAVYAVALLIIEQFRVLAQMGSVVLTPRLSSLNAKGDDNISRMLLLKWTKYSQLLSLGIGLPLMITGGSFLTLWMGAEYEESGVILKILTLPFFVVIPALAFSSYLLAVNKHRIAALIQLCEAVINLLLSLFLITKYEIIGVAVGTVIPSVIFTGVIIPLKVCTMCGISFRTYAEHAFVKILPLGILHIALLQALNWLLGSDTWGMFLLNNFVGAGIFAVISYMVIFDGEDRAYIKRRIGG